MLLLGALREWDLLMLLLPLILVNVYLTSIWRICLPEGLGLLGLTDKVVGGANMSRIDRVVVNAAWMDAFPNSEDLAHSPGISDHCSLIVTVCKEDSCKKPFRFFYFWMKHHSFKDLVFDSWIKPISGSAMLRLSLKLKSLKPILRDLNANCFSNISGRVVEAR